MKKIILTAVIAVLLTGCGNEVKQTELEPEGTEKIIVETIEVETIEDNMVTWDTAEEYIATWGGF